MIWYLTTLGIDCTADYTQIGTAVIAAVHRAAFAGEVEAAQSHECRKEEGGRRKEEGEWKKAYVS